MQDTPIISPDGQAVWNGTEWMPYAPSAEAPAPQPPATEKPTMKHLGLKITGGVLAILVAVGIATAEGREDTGAEAATPTSGYNAPANESESAVEGLSLPGGCYLYELVGPTPYKRWVANMTDPIANTTGHNVDNVAMVAEVLRDGQVVGVESLGPFTHNPLSTGTPGVPLDRDWPINLSTDSCRLSLVSYGSQPATRWIGASTQPKASEPPTYRGLSIGMSIAEAEATGVVVYEEEAYGEGSPGMLVPVDGGFDNFTIWNSETELTALGVSKPDWSTPEGITVGSSASDVYGAFSNAVPDDIATHVILVDNGAWGYQFFTEDGVVTGIAFGRGVGEFAMFD